MESSIDRTEGLTGFWDEREKFRVMLRFQIWLPESVEMSVSELGSRKSAQCLIF
jgi:hypothetical protein